MTTVGSEHKISHRELAEAEFENDLCNLAANMLRTVRGAGHPAAILGQCAAIAQSSEQYREAFGHWPASASIARVLSCENLMFDGRNQGTAREDRAEAEIKIMKGSLQILASQFLEQNVQASAGTTEMVNGIRDFLSTISDRN